MARHWRIKQLNDDFGRIEHEFPRDSTTKGCNACLFRRPGLKVRSGCPPCYARLLHWPNELPREVDRNSALGAPSPFVLAASSAGMGTDEQSTLRFKKIAAQGGGAARKKTSQRMNGISLHVRWRRSLDPPTLPILKSSILRPVFMAAANQRGCFPRPDHVSCGT